MAKAPDNAAIVAALRRVTVHFQARTIAAVMNLPPPVPAPERKS